MPNKYRKAGADRGVEKTPTPKPILRGDPEGPLGPLSRNERDWAKNVADQKPGYWNQLDEAVKYLRKRSGKDK
jgi:hypothetical protein